MSAPGVGTRRPKRSGDKPRAGRGRWRAVWQVHLWLCGSLLGWSVAQAEDGASGLAREPLVVPRVLVIPISEIEVPAKATGTLSEISVRVGDLVEAGALLARVDDTEARMAEGLAEVEWEIAGKQAEGLPLVQAAEQAAEVAERNLARAEQALANFGRSITQAEMDDYRLKATETKASLWERRQSLEIAMLNHQLRARQLDLARDQTRRHQVLSPAKGMVKELAREAGEWVIPGQPVVRVIRLDRLRCVGFVPAARVRNSDAPATWIGRRATLLVPSAEDPEARQFVGQVTFLDPEIEPESDQVRLWVEIDNADLRLHPGDRGTLRIDWAAGSAD